MSLARVQELTDLHGAVLYELAAPNEPEGNAFPMLGVFRLNAHRWGWPASAVSEVCREATSGDYAHLRAVLATATGARCARCGIRG